jgi:hypothetical protein
MGAKCGSTWRKAITSLQVLQSATLDCPRIRIPNAKLNSRYQFAVYAVNFFLFFCLFYLCFSFTSLFSSSATVRCESWLPILAYLPPFPMVFRHCLPVFLLPSYLSLLQPRPSIFHVSSPFPCSCCYLFWHSLVLHSFNMTTLSSSKGFYKFYNTFPL